MNGMKGIDKKSDIDPKRAEELKQGAICKRVEDVLWNVVHNPNINKAMRELDAFDSRPEKETSKKKWEILLEKIQGALTGKIKDKEQLKELIDILESNSIRSNKNLSDAIQEYLTWNKSKNKQSNEQTSYEDLKNPDVREFVRKFWGTKKNFKIEKVLNLLRKKIYRKYRENITEKEKEELKKELKKIYKFKNETYAKKIISAILGNDKISEIWFDSNNNEIKNIMYSGRGRLVENYKIQTEILDLQWNSHKIIEHFPFRSTIKIEPGKWFPLITEKEGNTEKYTVQTTIEVIWINGKKEIKRYPGRDKESTVRDNNDVKNIMNNQENYTLKREKNGKLYIQIEETLKEKIEKRKNKISKRLNKYVFNFTKSPSRSNILDEWKNIKESWWTKFQKEEIIQSLNELKRKKKFNASISRYLKENNPSLYNKCLAFIPSKYHSYHKEMKKFSIEKFVDLLIDDVKMANEKIIASEKIVEYLLSNTWISTEKIAEKYPEEFYNYLSDKIKDLKDKKYIISFDENGGINISTTNEYWKIITVCKNSKVGEKRKLVFKRES